VERGVGGEGEERGSWMRGGGEERGREFRYRPINGLDTVYTCSYRDCI